MKTKADFVLDLIKEARTDRGTNAAAKRTVKACRSLGLDDAEVIRVMSYMDYCDSFGKPYGNLIKRCW